MSNAEFISNKSNKTKINNSESKKMGQRITGVLLFISCLLLITIGQKIRFPIMHNSIIVGRGNRPYYAFSVDQFRKTYGVLPRNLGGEAEWSPDGRWIVFSLDEPTHGTNISHVYIMQADGGQRTRISLPQGSTWGDWGKEPTWSPDGKQIAFAAPMGIIIADVTCLLQGNSCTPESHLFAEVHWSHDPDWSPDGRQIIYTAVRNAFVINVDGQVPLVTLTLAMQQARWSPDGTKIAGVCNYNICVANKDGSNLIYLTNNRPYSLIEHPRWSPDGQKIAYISMFSNKPIFGFCGPDSGCPLPTSVFIIDMNGNAINHLPFDNNRVIDWFTWYP